MGLASFKPNREEARFLRREANPGSNLGPWDTKRCALRTAQPCLRKCTLLHSTVNTTAVHTTAAQTSPAHTTTGQNSANLRSVTLHSTLPHYTHYSTRVAAGTWGAQAPLDDLAGCGEGPRLGRRCGAGGAGAVSSACGRVPPLGASLRQYRLPGLLSAVPEVEVASPA